MEPQQINKINNKAYQQIADNFNATTTRSEKVMQYLDMMVEKLSKDSLVLDIGCGSGFYTEYLTKKVKAIGIDISDAMITAAKKEYPSCQFEIGDMRQLPYEESTISGLAAIASLLHIPKKEAQSVLQEFKRVLKNGSRAVFVMKQPDPAHSGDGLESRERSGVVITRYFARYSKDEFIKKLSDNGFKVIKSEVMYFAKDDPEPWSIILTEVEK